MLLVLDQSSKHCANGLETKNGTEKLIITLNKRG